MEGLSECIAIHVLFALRAFQEVSTGRRDIDDRSHDFAATEKVYGNPIEAGQACALFYQTLTVT